MRRITQTRLTGFRFGSATPFDFRFRSISFRPKFYCPPFLRPSYSPSATNPSSIPSSSMNNENNGGVNNGGVNNGDNRKDSKYENGNSTNKDNNDKGNDDGKKKKYNYKKIAAGITIATVTTTYAMNLMNDTYFHKFKIPFVPYKYYPLNFEISSCKEIQSAKSIQELYNVCNTEEVKNKISIDDWMYIEMHIVHTCSDYRMFVIDRIIPFGFVLEYFEYKCGFGKTYDDLLDYARKFVLLTNEAIEKSGSNFLADKSGSNFLADKSGSKSQASVSKPSSESKVIKQRLFSSQAKLSEHGSSQAKLSEHGSNHQENNDNMNMVVMDYDHHFGNPWRRYDNFYNVLYFNDTSLLEAYLSIDRLNARFLINDKYFWPMLDRLEKHGFDVPRIQSVLSNYFHRTLGPRASSSEKYSLMLKIDEDYKHRLNKFKSDGKSEGGMFPVYPRRMIEFIDKL